MAGEVDDYGAGEAGGEAHVVDDLAPAAVGELGLDVGRDGGEARLPGGVHGAGGEVLDEAVEEETRGLSADQGPRSRVRVWRLAKPAKGRLVKSLT